MDNPTAVITATVDNSEAESVSTFLESVNERIQEIAGKIEEGSTDAVDNLSAFVQMEQWNSISDGDHIDTGALLSSITIDNQGLSARIGSNLSDSYAPNVIEYGRGEVRPVQARCLHYWTKYGEEVFSMYSAPFPADPYVAPSVESAKDKAKEVFIESIKGAL